MSQPLKESPRYNLAEVVQTNHTSPYGRLYSILKSGLTNLPSNVNTPEEGDECTTSKLLKRKMVESFLEPEHGMWCCWQCKHVASSESKLAAHIRSCSQRNSDCIGLPGCPFCPRDAFQASDWPFPVGTFNSHLAREHPDVSHLICGYCLEVTDSPVLEDLIHHILSVHKLPWRPSPASLAHLRCDQLPHRVVTCLGCGWCTFVLRASNAAQPPTSLESHLNHCSFSGGRVHLTLLTHEMCASKLIQQQLLEESVRASQSFTQVFPLVRGYPKEVTVSQPKEINLHYRPNGPSPVKYFPISFPVGRGGSTGRRGGRGGKREANTPAKDRTMFARSEKHDPKTPSLSRLERLLGAETGDPAPASCHLCRTTDHIETDEDCEQLGCQACGRIFFGPGGRIDLIGHLRVLHQDADHSSALSCPHAEQKPNEKLTEDGSCVRVRPCEALFSSPRLRQVHSACRATEHPGFACPMALELPECENQDALDLPEQLCMAIMETETAADRAGLMILAYCCPNCSRLFAGFQAPTRFYFHNFLTSCELDLKFTFSTKMMVSPGTVLSPTATGKKPTPKKPRGRMTKNLIPKPVNVVTPTAKRVTFDVPVTLPPAQSAVAKNACKKSAPVCLYVCPLCGDNALASLRERDEHLQSAHNGELVFPCQICGLAYPLYIALRRHAALKHNADYDTVRYGPVELLDSEPIECPECHLVAFTDRAVVKLHLVQVHKLEPDQAKSLLRSSLRKSQPGTTVGRGGSTGRRGGRGGKRED
ncbi:hypothetical protein AHF37_08259 [Paragonimus kellicotti]|nr:hypothetical protein AHF37_08259 [Paragonimus kellicotti]